MSVFARFALVTALGAIVLGATASARDLPRPTPGPQGEPTPHVEPTSSVEEDHAEIRRLFAEVERTLRRIDGVLGEARTAHAPVELAGGIQRASDGGRAVVRDIDRILELVQHPHPPGGT